MASDALGHGRHSVPHDRILQLSQPDRSPHAPWPWRNDNPGGRYLERHHHRFDVLRCRLCLARVGQNCRSARPKNFAVALKLCDRDIHRGNGIVHQCVAVLRGARDGLMGMFAGFSTSAMALVASQAPERRLGYALGWLSSGQMVGSLVGPVLGGILADATGSFRIPFYITIGRHLRGLGLVWFVVKEDFTPRQKPARSRDRCCRE